MLLFASKEAQGNLGGADVPSADIHFNLHLIFGKGKKIFHPLDRHQSNSVTFLASKSERCPEVSWGSEGSTKGGKMVREAGQTVGWKWQEFARR